MDLCHYQTLGNHGRYFHQDRYCPVVPPDCRNFVQNATYRCFLRCHHLLDETSTVSHSCHDYLACDLFTRLYSSATLLSVVTNLIHSRTDLEAQQLWIATALQILELYTRKVDVRVVILVYDIHTFHTFFLDRARKEYPAQFWSHPCLRHGRNCIRDIPRFCR